MSLMATDSIETAIENASRDHWLTSALLAISQLARRGYGFDVDHVRQMVGEPPAMEYWGCAFSVAQRQKLIEPVGARINRMNRPVRIWYGLPAADSSNNGADG